MHNDVVSRHLGSSGELLLLIPIKLGFAPIPELVLTYATRLKSLLETLYEMRARKYQRGFGEPSGPVERLETLSRVQWTVIETQQKIAGDRQISGSQLLVSAHYDRSWEDYFRRLRRESGDLLDLIFSHCVGFDHHTCRDDYEQFIGWIREHQRGCNFMYAGSPDVTADDILYLKQLAKNARDYERRNSLADDLAALQVPPRIATTDDDAERVKAAYRTVLALADMRDRMFSNSPELSDSQAARTGFNLFDSALGTVLSAEPDVTNLLAGPEVEESSGDPKPLEAARFTDPVDRILNPLLWARTISQQTRPSPAHQPRVHVVDESLADHVQVNILTGGLVTKAADSDSRLPLFGCLLLVSVPQRSAWTGFLSAMRERCTTAGRGGGSEDVIVNLAITYSGFERMGLSSEVLEQFPPEFRQGMEARAALLGDSDINDPYNWQHPDANTQAGSSERIHLSTVDALILLQSRRDLCRVAPEAPWTCVPGLAAALNGADVVHVQRLDRGPKRNANGRWEDHFGFVDGVSQPIPNISLPLLREKLDECKPRRDRVPLGELLLGHPNRHSEIARCASPEQNADSHELFVNGTYLVVRKYAQNVADFTAWIEKAAEALDVRDPESIRLRVLGRKSNGEPPPDPPANLEKGVARARLGERSLDAAEPTGLNNDFDYSKDPAGKVCPFHSHIRRANPRSDVTAEPDPNRTIDPVIDIPRIMRRGMSYTPLDPTEATGERGLMFMAFNASIADQYEILQRWLNGGNSTRIYSAQNDILTAPNISDRAPHWVQLETATGWKTVALPPREKAFVELRWGMYLFMPAPAALSWLVERIGTQPHAACAAPADSCDRAALLARRDLSKRAWELALGSVSPDPRTASAASNALAQPRDYAPCADRGRQRIREIEGLPANQQRAAWKQILEEAVLADSRPWREAEDIWAAIRETPHGVCETPAGYLVGSELGARRVLGDDGRTFSVSEYGSRLRQTSGDHYLGHDDVPATIALGGGHQQLAKQPNAYFQTLEHDAFRRACDIASRFLVAPPASMQQERILPDSTRSAVSVRDLVRFTIAELCHVWFEMPFAEIGDEGHARGLALDLFLLQSRNAFQHAPEPRLIDDAIQAGAAIRKRYAEVHRDRTAGDMADYLRAEHYFENDPNQERHIREAVIGAVVGFAPPAYGSVLRTIDQWIENGQFWAIQQLARRADHAEYDAELRRILVEGIRRTPIAPILYRTAKRAVALGDTNIPAGARVIVSVSSAFTDARAFGYDAPDVWLFGGKHGAQEPLETHAPPHGCPAREAGMQVMLGVLRALCAQTNIRRERRGVLSYDRTD